MSRDRLLADQELRGREPPGDGLLDRFAAAALTGILANPNARAIHPDDVAKLAYPYAEAMMRERRR